MHVGLLATWLCAAASAAPQPPAAEPAPEPVALVELFTSEGCSSCPAAEAVLAELAQEAQEDGVPVIPIALHVTAWDALGGWTPSGCRRRTRDRCSTRTSSARGGATRP